jgi:hypothetical protein
MSRYYLIPVLALLVSLGACSKDSDSNPNNDKPKDDDNPTVPTVPTGGKKGADFSTTMTTHGKWNENIVALKSHWYYTWGKNLDANTPKNCEFVPMFWGAADVTTANIAAVQKLKTEGKAKYVLGFNEPNRSDQANMTVSKALSLWPQLESIGLPLGSPAADWPTRQWIYDFLDSCIVQKKRVDFICVHMYIGTDDNAFVQTLQDLYNKYKKPIWITEFATADWSAATAAVNPYKPEQVLAFMQRLLPKLEQLDYVHRYSWFSGDTQSAAMWSSALVDAQGKLTTLGSWYANYKPNNGIAQ